MPETAPEREASSRSALRRVRQEPRQELSQELSPVAAVGAQQVSRPVPEADERREESAACPELRQAARRLVPAEARRSDAQASHRERPVQPEARWVGVLPARQTARVVLRALQPAEEAEARPDVQTAVEAVLSSEQARAQAQLLELPLAAGEEPSVLRTAAVVEAQRAEPQGEAVAVQPSEVRVAAAERRAEERAVEEARHAAAQAVAAEQRAVVPAAEQAQPSEAQEVRPSAELSARSDRQARAQPARRRMTAAFRHEPALAQAVRLRLQSSSAEGVEGSS